MISILLAKMAEALCGPSNPLQNLQKHTSVDRTLQQDRNVLRRSPAEGFRTSSPFAGSLDAEFQAFQAPQSLKASPLSFQQPPLHDPHLPIQSPNPPQFSTSVQQNLPSWASDFQRLNINSPQSSASSFQPKTISSRNVASDGWHHDFMAQSYSQARQVPQHSNAGSNFNMQPQFQNQPFLDHALSHAPSVQQQPEQMLEERFEFDEAAFEQAFDAAKAASEEAESKIKGKERVEEGMFSMGFACTDPGDVMGEYDFDQHASTLGLDTQETHMTRHQDNLKFDREDLGVHSTPPPEELPRIGSDTIPPRNESDLQTEVDELARTAGQLLDSLQGEQNSKFQQSSFLGLMRQLRDKEIRIEGDKMVSVSTS